MQAPCLWCAESRGSRDREIVEYMAKELAWIVRWGVNRYYAGIYLPTRAHEYVASDTNRRVISIVLALYPAQTRRGPRMIAGAVNQRVSAR